MYCYKPWNLSWCSGGNVGFWVARPLFDSRNQLIPSSCIIFVKENLLSTNYHLRLFKQILLIFFHSSAHPGFYSWVCRYIRRKVEIWIDHHLHVKRMSWIIFYKVVQLLPGTYILTHHDDVIGNLKILKYSSFWKSSSIKEGGYNDIECILWFTWAVDKSNMFRRSMAQILNFIPWCMLHKQWISFSSVYFYICMLKNSISNFPFILINNHSWSTW